MIDNDALKLTSSLSLQKMINEQNYGNTNC